MGKLFKSLFFTFFDSTPLDTDDSALNELSVKFDFIEFLIPGRTYVSWTLISVKWFFRDKDFLDVIDIVGELEGFCL